MKVMHLCLCGPYSDDYDYQDNLLPLKHHEMGLEVKVLVSVETWESDGKRGKRKPQRYINQHGYEIEVLPYLNGKRSEQYRLFKGLYDAIDSFHPDILFCHGGLTFSYKEIIDYLKKNPETKFYMDNHIDNNISGIIHLSGIDKKKRYLMYRFLWGHCVRALSRYAKKVWGVTPARVEFLQEVFRVDPQKTDLLVMGADEKEIAFSSKDLCRKLLHKKCSVGNETYIIISGGKIDKYKNIPNLIRSMSYLTDMPVHLAVFGSPDDEMINELNDSLKGKQNVTMLGWASTKEITEYFLGADLAIYPGRHSVLWEKTVACGLPCIIRRAEGMQHVDVGGNCMFYDGDTPEEIAEAIRFVFSGNKKLSAMRAIAEEKGTKVFSYSQIARRAIEMEDSK